MFLELSYSDDKTFRLGAPWLGHVQLFVTPWTVACQGPLSMGFSKQEYWSRLPCPPPGDLPSPGIKPGSPAMQADPLPSEPPGKPITLEIITFATGIVQIKKMRHTVDPGTFLEFQIPFPREWDN